MPTPAQRSAFLHHLMGAHSWHLKLPLLTGGTFVIVLAPDGKESYGKLDYMWRIEEGDVWTRDGAEPLRLEPSIPVTRIEQVFPYISCGHDFIGMDLCKKDLKLIRSGAAHPHKELLLEWSARLADEAKCWETLSDDEKSMVVTLDLQDAQFIEFGTSAKVTQALGLLRKTNEIWRKLHQEEITKVKTAIEQLEAQLTESV